VVVCCREIVRFMFMVAEEAQKKPGEMCDVCSTLILFNYTRLGRFRCLIDGQSDLLIIQTQNPAFLTSKDLQGDNVT